MTPCCTHRNCPPFTCYVAVWWRIFDGWLRLPLGHNSNEEDAYADCIRTILDLSGMDYRGDTL